MKKMTLLLVLLAVSVCAESIEKKGFLTSKWCAQNGYFSDCRLESFVCGSGECFKSWEFGDNVTDELVLFVHNEQKIYTIDYSTISRYKLDEPMNRSDVTIMGELRGDTIIASGFKAPPPPQKSFFKGCL
ncbi:hypothetical protein [Sulfurospirillum halorespirans]|uniref:Putative periplasmic protein n=1 Tax=Sulfurospirillum halorespirans DSM 13726 TaxID=1193502 RepID=A0A1D7TP15_9BACT|nr:hypothetical protein [Sulfurospirillum halorespirans]AOO66727.1 putative periplasmic protein [Sulfurospirillum halorespirans DSM 13726]